MNASKVVKSPKANVKDTTSEDNVAVDRVIFGDITLFQSDLDKLSEQFKAARGRIEAAGKKAMDMGIIRSRTSWLGDLEVAGDSKQILTISRNLYKQGLISLGDSLALVKFVNFRRALGMLTDGNLIK